MAEESIRSHPFTMVVVIASIFLFLTMTISAAVVVFCKKRNSVFALQKSEEDCEYEMDDIHSDGEISENESEAGRKQLSEHLRPPLLESDYENSPVHKALFPMNFGEVENSPSHTELDDYTHIDDRGAYQRMVVTAVMENPMLMSRGTGKIDENQLCNKRTRHLMKTNKSYYGISAIPSDIESDYENSPSRKPLIKYKKNSVEDRAVYDSSVPHVYEKPVFLEDESKLCMYRGGETDQQVCITVDGESYLCSYERNGNETGYIIVHEQLGAIGGATRGDIGGATGGDIGGATRGDMGGPTGGYRLKRKEMDDGSENEQCDKSRRFDPRKSSSSEGDPEQTDIPHEWSMEGIADYCSDESNSKFPLQHGWEETTQGTNPNKPQRFPVSERELSELEKVKNIEQRKREKSELPQSKSSYDNVQASGEPKSSDNRSSGLLETVVTMETVSSPIETYEDHFPFHSPSFYENFPQPNADTTFPSTPVDNTSQDIVTMPTTTTQTVSIATDTRVPPPIPPRKIDNLKTVSQNTQDQTESTISVIQRTHSDGYLADSDSECSDNGNGRAEQ